MTISRMRTEGATNSHRVVNKRFFSERFARDIIVQCTHAKRPTVVCIVEESIVGRNNPSRTAIRLYNPQRLAIIRINELDHAGVPHFYKNLIVDICHNLIVIKEFGGREWLDRTQSCRAWTSRGTDHLSGLHVGHDNEGAAIFHHACQRVTKSFTICWCDRARIGFGEDGRVDKFVVERIHWSRTRVPSVFIETQGMNRSVTMRGFERVGTHLRNTHCFGNVASPKNN